MVIAVNILFYKWSNTNGVTKSPTAPQEAMAQLRSWMIPGLAREHSSPWRVPVEKQQQQTTVKNGVKNIQTPAYIGARTVID